MARTLQGVAPSEAGVAATAGALPHGNLTVPKIWMRVIQSPRRARDRADPRPRGAVAEVVAGRTAKTTFRCDDCRDVHPKSVRPSVSQRQTLDCG